MIGAVVVVAALTGCGVFVNEFAEGDYAETIPEALLEADLAITDAFASKGLDGFTAYLAVGIDIDQTELSEQALADMLRIVVNENDLPADQMLLTVQNVEGDFIDLGQMVERIAPDVGTNYVRDVDLTITTDEAREIVEAVDRQR
ncbi:hypothetical protein CW368_12125 [Actinomycetales bacterium SN12]|nr:hypothetical protein CW368_12125 [Actinomycetales bacterium SN12]